MATKGFAPYCCQSVFQSKPTIDIEAAGQPAVSAEPVQSTRVPAFSAQTHGLYYVDAEFSSKPVTDIVPPAHGFIQGAAVVSISSLSTPLPLLDSVTATRARPARRR
eukprot:TRINITY_DN11853_c0_g1_i1.p1 TRINITY_DN11853_c0_g1~~TRINITY_DN11853_c0_g1_i1.p1  ORF type:complete len:107 (-),score=9.32 TRINITY_DN11853_c0_g1_i1:214-534(-)